jgi:tetraacyldisaccharide 4'-kinase
VEWSLEYRRVLSGDAPGVGSAALRLLLALAALPYAGVVALRNWLYDKGLLRERRVDAPVISVGNLTVGGTGKTPAVAFAARWFREHGARPAILSRGYRARDGRNDEALLLAARLPSVPHRQLADRVLAAREAISDDGANVLVLDDGFQHRRLGRFGDVVLIDATCPFGYGRLLPRGLLREPLGGLRRADIVVITRADLVDDAALQSVIERVKEIAPDVPVATAVHEPATLVAFPHGAESDPGSLSGQEVGLFCSIGNPDAFRQTVERLGAMVGWWRPFPDHHWYTAADVAAIAAAPVRRLVTTEKDAAKLVTRPEAAPAWPADRPLSVLRVEMALRIGSGAVEQLFREALDAAEHVG